MAQVDPATGMYINEYTGEYFLFPRHVDKTTTYRVRNATYLGVPVTFQREEDIGGLHTYVFTYQGDFDNSTGYPDVPLEDGQVILCLGFELNYSVEPVTGEVVKYREWCEGDYVIDTTTGEPLYGLQRWGTEPSIYDDITQARYIQERLTNYLWMTSYVPLLLLVLGLGALAVGGYQLLRARPQAVPS